VSVCAGYIVKRIPTSQEVAPMQPCNFMTTNDSKDARYLHRSFSGIVEGVTEFLGKLDAHFAYLRGAAAYLISMMVSGRCTRSSSNSRYSGTAVYFLAA